MINTQEVTGYTFRITQTKKNKALGSYKKCGQLCWTLCKILPNVQINGLVVDSSSYATAWTLLCIGGHSFEVCTLEDMPPNKI